MTLRLHESRGRVIVSAGSVRMLDRLNQPSGHPSSHILRWCREARHPIRLLLASHVTVKEARHKVWVQLAKREGYNIRVGQEGTCFQEESIAIVDELTDARTGGREGGCAHDFACRGHIQTVDFMPYKAWTENAGSSSDQTHSPSTREKVPLYVRRGAWRVS